MRPWDWQDRPRGARRGRGLLPARPGDQGLCCGSRTSGCSRDCCCSHPGHKGSLQYASRTLKRGPGQRRSLGYQVRAPKNLGPPPTPSGPHPPPPGPLCGWDPDFLVPPQPVLRQWEQQSEGPAGPPWLPCPRAGTQQMRAEASWPTAGTVGTPSLQGPTAAPPLSALHG